MKFGVPLQILVLRTVTWQSIKILQIQSGGRPPYWKSFLAIFQRFIVKLAWNLIRKSRITFRYKSHDQNTKIWKFKMADDRQYRKWFHHYISAADHPISMKFSVPLHNLFARRSIIKVSIFCKFTMADGRFVCERLYVGLQISWVLWVNRRCPILIVIQG